MAANSTKTCESKVCTGCGEEKPAEAFSRRKTGYLMARCKKCRAAEMLKRHHDPEHHERHLANLRQYYHDNKERVFKSYELLRHHGITLDAYKALLVKQKNGCAICGFVPGDGEQMLSVDHDHATGAIRGLLCNRCNLGIGYFSDDPVRLRSAAKYLIRAMA